MKNAFTLIVLMSLTFACGQNLGPTTLPEDVREGTSAEPDPDVEEGQEENEPLTPLPGEAPGEEEETETPPTEPVPEDPEAQGSALFLENQSCVEWTDCGPHFANPNSGAECVDSQCVCDPNGEWDDACAGLNGFFIEEECLCIITSVSPPEYSEPDCYPHWIDEDDCQDRYWVDTSYYEEECFTQNGQEYCDERYVPDGYWVTEGCDAGRWIERCN